MTTPILNLSSKQYDHEIQTMVKAEINDLKKILESREYPGTVLVRVYNALLARGDYLKSKVVRKHINARRENYSQMKV